MQNIGVLIETTDGVIKKTNFGVISAARGDGRELYAFLLDTIPEDQKSRLQDYGVSKLVEIHSQDSPLGYHPVSWSQAIVQAMIHYGIDTLLGLASIQGQNLLPRIAADLKAPLVMDCSAVDLAAHIVQKSQFSGRAVATLRSEGDFHIYGIRPNAIEASPFPCRAETISFEAEIKKDGLALIELKLGDSSGIDLTEADVIISGGRGIGNSENFRVLSDCAEKIGAAVGSSRVAVDEGWVPYAMQVGQTGKTVSPKVYIACGISGSVQHFAGMKTAAMVIAINRDPEAAIIKKCDYFVVADLFDIVPALTGLLQAATNREE
ncbi:MAG: electron transfer flavoprotein subunit alpha/FixB family protein [Desulfobacterales bacterium]|jgi:electron transfer flavoprotein alpha subunit